MFAERRIFFLGALPGRPGRLPPFLRPYVRPSVRAAPRRPSRRDHPFLDPKKHQKQFKTNGFGTFDGAPLASLLARMCFFDPPLMAQQRPKSDSPKRCKTNMILHILLFGVLLVAAPGAPFLPQNVKIICVFQCF